MPNRYTTIEVLKSSEGRRYYKNVIYPKIPVSEDDIYIITSEEDRYDTLAQQFYGDHKLWWVIASSNSSKKDGMVVRPGIQLRIPASAAQAVQLFQEVNEKR